MRKLKIILAIGSLLLLAASLPLIRESNGIHFFPDGIEAPFVSGTSNASLIDVRDKGARCDGATDDTFAIQAAMDAGNALLPCGTCKITSNLLLKRSDQQVYGLGLCTKIVQFTAGQSCFVNSLSPTRLFRVQLKSMQCGANTGITTGIGIDWSDVSDSFMEEVYVSNTGGGTFLTGISLHSTSTGGAYRDLLYNVLVQTSSSTSAVGVRMDADTGNISAENRILGGNIRADTGIGVLIASNGTTLSPNGNVVEAVDFEGTTAVGVDILGCCTSGNGAIATNYIAGNRFEGMTTRAVRMDDKTLGNVVIGNLITSGTPSPEIEDNGDNIIIGISKFDTGFPFKTSLRSRHLNLNPTDTPTQCNSSNKGYLTFDTSMDRLCFCDGTNWCDASQPTICTSASSCGTAAPAPPFAPSSCPTDMAIFAPSGPGSPDTTASRVTQSTAGQVFCQKYIQPCTIAATQIGARINVGVATAQCGVAIYDSSGSLLLNSGVKTCDTSAANITTASLSATLTQGAEYLACFASDQTATLAFVGLTGTSGLNTIFTGKQITFTAANLAQYNAQCTAAATPYACCTGTGTGTCAGFPATLGTLAANTAFGVHVIVAP